MSDPIRVYQPASAGAKRRGVFYCVSCCDPEHAKGKFHAPIMVEAIDLQDKVCGICLKPLLCEYVRELGNHVLSADGHCVGCCYINVEHRKAWEASERSETAPGSAVSKARG